MKFNIKPKNCIDFKVLGRWEKLQRAFFEEKYSAIPLVLSSFQSWFEEYKEILHRIRPAEIVKMISAIDQINDAITYLEDSHYKEFSFKEKSTGSKRR